MTIEQQAEKLNELIANVSSEKHYWFFRSMGGIYFKEFYEEGYIAIGYDEILLRDLEDLPEKDNSAREMIKARLKSKRPDFTPNKIATAAGQIIKFYRSVNVGDFVMVPSSESKSYAFGIVTTNMFEDSSEHGFERCPFAKRRKVKWLKIFNRCQLDPKLLLALGNQQTLSSIDDYSLFIDRKINNLYAKGDKSYLVIRVNQDNGLSWDDFYFITDLGDLFKFVSQQGGIAVDLTKIEMKINVQSPGDILLIANGGDAYLLIIAFIALLCLLPGGKVNLWKIQFESKGLGCLLNQIVDAVNKFLNEQQERKLRLQERTKNLKIEQINENQIFESESEIRALPSSLEEIEDDNEQTE